MNHRVKMSARFPLTPALSPGERGRPLNIFLKFGDNQAEVCVGFIKTLGAFLPLPEGEGWGEGEGGSHFFRRS